MASYRNPNCKISLSIIDADIVEAKNLERQCFIDDDIGKCKALVMAEVIKAAFDLLRIYAYPIYIDEKSQLEKIFNDMHDEARDSRHYSNNTHIDILIGAVDNHRARQVMECYFRKRRSIIYFDAANEFSNGEVVFGGKHEGRIMGQSRAYYYPGIMKSRSKRASEISCGAINKSDPQHMLTNMMAANLLLAKVIPMISGTPIVFGIAYFDAFESFSKFNAYEMKGGCLDAGRNTKKAVNPKKDQEAAKAAG